MITGAYRFASHRQPLPAGHRAGLRHRHRASLSLALLAALSCQQAAAAPTASADAYDLSVNISVLGGVQSLTVLPQARTTAAAQPLAFHLTQTAAPISVGSDPVAPLVTLTTGNLNAEAQWIPPATPQGFFVVGSQGSASNVALNAINLVSASLLSLNAQLIRATALVSGYCPPAGQAPMVSLDGFVDDVAADAVYRNGFDAQNLHGGLASENNGLAVSVTGSAFAIPVDPAANTTLNLLGGAAVLVLNEQVQGGDGITGASMSGNALHLSVNLPGVLTAEVIIGHASVGVSCN